MRRGEIWWASFPVPAASAPGYRRPVLVVQSNAFNESKIHTVIVLALTTNMHLASAPGNVRITRRQSGLQKDSVVNVSQIMTVNRSMLTEKAGELTELKLEEIAKGLRRILVL